MQTDKNTLPVKNTNEKHTEKKKSINQHIATLSPKNEINVEW